MEPHYFDVAPSQFEQVIESRSAPPEPAVQPGNDTGVITHVLAAGVKRWNRNSYHSVTRIRRVVTSACLSQHRGARALAPRPNVGHVRVTVLVGGVGGARFLLGVQRLLGLGQFGGSPSDDELTAIVNVGDDAWMYGVRICPDLDTCMYTLGGGIDPERGWGLSLIHI